ncbi:MAG TPA: hypothetical protein VFU15_06500 [Bacteroidia bacterium]|nr:hypothetical protein [Bacteroidia bacterium]
MYTEKTGHVIVESAGANSNAQVTVSTTYGKFIQKSFTKVRNALGRAEGVNMYMEFEPNERVIDAKKIAFVQSEQEMKGANDPVTDQTHTDASGLGIDQYVQYRNPLYSTGEDLEATKGKPSQGDKLEDYKDRPVRKARFNKEDTAQFHVLGRKKAGWGEFGSRYSMDGKFVSKNATFQDTPFVSGGPEGSSAKFETSVVVADGWQTGLYLGSVTWSWDRTNRKFHDQGIQLKSMGTPSEDFFKAADTWNASGTTGGKKNIPLPMSSGTIKQDKANLYADESGISTGKAAAQLEQSAACRIVDAMVILQSTYLHIRVLDGVHKGAEGWVQEADVDSDKMFPKINNTNP